MSPRSTGSPVSASTGFSEMRLPVFGLIWLSRMRSASVVAGDSAIGHVTSETRRWPDQLGRGMRALSFEFRFNQGLEVPGKSTSRVISVGSLPALTKYG